jgi:DNA invertase Pin-like site-specific DNA recombinase
MSESPQKPRVPKGDCCGFFRQGEATARVGLYARVSTHDQQTLPLQLSAMREHAERRGWTVAVIVEDVGSGVRDRPKREDLMRAARRRELDRILVWRLDRWGRSLVDLITTLQELTALGVGFVSLGEALDLTTPSGRALAGMLAVFAEFERDILRDRVKAGIAQARKEGRPHGRPRTIARHEAEVKRLFQEGVSKREIAKRTGISRASVRHLLGDGNPWRAIFPVPRRDPYDAALRLVCPATGQAPPAFAVDRRGRGGTRTSSSPPSPPDGKARSLPGRLLLPDQPPASAGSTCQPSSSTAAPWPRKWTTATK